MNSATLRAHRFEQLQVFLADVERAPSAAARSAFCLNCNEKRSIENGRCLRCAGETFLFSVAAAPASQEVTT